MTVPSLMQRLVQASSVDLALKRLNQESTDAYLNALNQLMDASLLTDIQMQAQAWKVRNVLFNDANHDVIGLYVKLAVHDEELILEILDLCLIQCCDYLSTHGVAVDKEIQRAVRYYQPISRNINELAESSVNLAISLQLVIQLLEQVNPERSAITQHPVLAILSMLCSIMTQTALNLPLTKKVTTELIPLVIDKLSDIRDESLLLLHSNIVQCWRETDILLRMSLEIIALTLNHLFKRDKRNQTIVHDILLADRDDFFALLQSGLSCSDSVSQKTAAYILKKLIAYAVAETKNEFFHPLIASLGNNLKRFWDDFLLIYDLLAQQSPHLVEPILVKFKCFTLLAFDSGCYQWVDLLYSFGIHNSGHSIRKMLLNFVIRSGIDDTEFLTVLCANWSLMTDTVIPGLDDMNLFDAPCTGSLESPFGRTLARFFGKILLNMNDPLMRTNFLKAVLSPLTKFQSFFPAIFIFTGLSEALPQILDQDYCWKEDQLKELDCILSMHGSFAPDSCRPILRAAAFPCVEKLVCFDMRAYSTLQGVIINHFTTMLSSVDIQGRLCSMLTKNDQISIEESTTILRSAIQTYLNSVSEGEIYLNYICLCIALFGKTNANFVCNVLIDMQDVWAQIPFRPYMPLPIKLKAILFYITLDRVAEKLNVQMIFDQNSQSLIENLVGFGLNQCIEHDGSNVNIWKSLFEVCLKKRIDISEKTGILNRIATDALQLANSNGFDLLSFSLQQACGTANLSAVSGVQIQSLIRSKVFQDELKKGNKRTYELLNATISYFSSQTSHDSDFLKFIWEYCSNLISSLPGIGLSIVVDSMRIMIAKDVIEVDEEEIACLINTTVQSFNDLYEPSNVIKNALESIVSCFIQNNLIRRYPTAVSGLIDILLTWGEERQIKVLSLVARNLHECWKDFNADVIANMNSMNLIIFKILLYEKPSNRYESIASTVRASFSVDSDPLADDDLSRFWVLDLILRLDTHNEAHQAFCFQLLDELIEMIRSTEGDDPRFTAFPGSPVFNRKIKAWQAIVLMIDVCISSEKCLYYFQTILELMSNENLVAIRYFAEWCIMKYLIQAPDFKRHYWAEMENVNMRSSYATSMLGICYHMTLLLRENTNDTDTTAIDTWFRTLFDLLLPHAASTNHLIRFMAFWTLSEAYKICSDAPKLAHLCEPPHLRRLIQSYWQSADFMKHRKRFESVYYLNKFDPIEDWCIDFLFDGMLKMGDVPQVMHVSADLLERIHGQQGVPRIPWRKSNRCYENIVSVDRILSASKSNASKQAPIEHEATDMVQRKIISWEAILDAGFAFGNSDQSIRTKQSHLIVYASYLDKPTNLGGLCRTCEIFGAQELIVDNLMIKNDKLFTALAMSSDRWMPITEVRKEITATYLKEKKRQGYTVVGLEQTSDSVNLVDFVFPERCILMLGNEAKGLPAEAIQLLDICVEIPQVGQTRSLNVHVSGALCIYSYARHHQII